MKTKTLSIALATLMIFSTLMVTVPTYAGPKETAMADGLAWLAGQQNPVDGSWGTYAQVGMTGLAVLKFETHAIQNDIDPLHPSYQYYNQCRRGLDYIFSTATIINIDTQHHDSNTDNPDTDGDGKGVYFGTRRTYETGIAMMAIASCTHPGMVVNVPGPVPPASAVNGWKYRHVVEDALDYLAWGQTDSGYGRGGWDYSEQDDAGPHSDNSNTGYAVLGLGYAQALAPGGFGLKVPDFVKNELDVYIEYIQNKDNATLDTPDPIGGSGYWRPDSWVNILKTGNLLYEMWFVGDKLTTPRVKAAINYLVRHWNDNNTNPGWRGWPGGVASYQAMYCTMKGLEAFGVEKIDDIDWQADFETVLLAEQLVNGSWPQCDWGDAGLILSTEWALLTLEKAVPPPPPPGIPEVKEELEAIEAKLDFWLPEIKKEVSDIWTYLTINITSMLVSIKDELTAIEEKLDFLVDKETVEIQVIKGEFSWCKKNYYMLTTIAGQKCNITSITIHAGDKLLDPSDYTYTCLYTGFYKIQIQKKAIRCIKPIVIQVECVQNGVTYYGAALTSTY